MSRPVKRLLTVVAVLGVLFVGALAALTALFPKERAAEFVVQKIRESTGREVELAGTSVGFFPGPSFALEGLTFGETAAPGAPRVVVERASLGLKLLPLLTRTIAVRNVVIENPVVEIVLDETAAAPEATGSEPVEVPKTGVSIDVERFDIRDAHVIVRRADGTPFAELTGLSETLSAKATGAGDLSLVGTTTLDGLSLELPAGRFGEGLALRLEKTLAYEADSDVATITKAVLDVAGVPIAVTGQVAGVTTRELLADLALSGGPGQVSALLGLVPSALMPPEMNGVTSSGTLELSGTIKGPLTDPDGPGFDVELTLADGTMQVPGMKKPVTDIRLDLTANPDVVHVRDFGLDTGESRLQVNSLIRDYRDDPRFEASIDANVLLDEVPYFVAGAETLGLGGRVNGKVTATGIASRPDDASINGTVGLDRVRAKVGTMPEPVNGMIGRLRFDRQQVSLEGLKAKLGRGSFEANGTLTDPMALDPRRTDGARARAAVTVSSKLLDVDAMMPVDPASTGEASTTTSSGAAAKRNIPELPPLDGTFTVTANRMLMNGAEARNVRGALTLTNGVAKLSDAHLDVFDGAIDLSGSMNLNERANPPFDVDVTVAGCSAQELFTFNQSLNRFALTAADHLQGRMNATSSMKGALNDTLGLDIPTLISSGDVKMYQVQLTEYPVQQALESYFKSSRFKSMQFSDFIQKFRIENGRLLFEKIEASGDGYGVIGSGWSSIDGAYELSLDLEIPPDMARGAQDKMPTAAQTILFSGRRGSFIVPVKVAGSRSASPSVTLDGKRLTDLAKAEASAAATDKVNEAKEEVAEAVKEQATDAIGDLLGGADADSTIQDAKDAIGGALKGLLKKKKK